MVEFDKGFWKILCAVAIGTCCLQSVFIGFTQKDLDWHRQEVYDSWNMQSVEKQRLVFEVSKLEYNLWDLNKQLTVCEIS